jgi:protein phosphatase
MGTTVAAVLLRGNRLSIAHVGDSRVYLARAHHIEQLTDDHCLAQPGMKHILTRALGASPAVDVDLDELTLSDGDTVVLCTDGLNIMVDDSAILSTVMSGKDPFKTCTRLVTIANKNGGRDNVTAIVAYAYKRSGAL